MHVYRFRLLYEDQEDFLRDIEIKSNQTFEDFHRIILQEAALDGKELASFYICNGKWSKLKEVTLLDMEAEAYEEPDEEDDNRKVSKVSYVMHQSQLKDFIEDPHQRLIYEYDYLKTQTFYLELLKIFPAETGVDYPTCSRREGSIQKQSAIPVVPSMMEEEGFDDFADIEKPDEESGELFAEGDLEGDEISPDVMELNEGFEETNF